MLLCKICEKIGKDKEICKRKENSERENLNC